MANYKQSNGKYYRQASDGNWFSVTAEKDGYFHWTLPNGLRVRSQEKIKDVFSSSQSDKDVLDVKAFYLMIGKQQRAKDPNQGLVSKDAFLSDEEFGKRYIEQLNRTNDYFRTHTLSPAKEKPYWQQLREKPFVERMREPLSYTPVLGDVLDLGDAAVYATDGKPVLAGILTAGVFLPNIIEKPVKKIVKEAAPYVEKVFNFFRKNNTDKVIDDKLSIVNPNSPKLLSAPKERTMAEKKQDLELFILTGNYFKPQIDVVDLQTTHGLSLEEANKIKLINDLVHGDGKRHGAIKYENAIEDHTFNDKEAEFLVKNYLVLHPDEEKYVKAYLLGALSKDGLKDYTGFSDSYIKTLEATLYREYENLLYENAKNVSKYRRRLTDEEIGMLTDDDLWHLSNKSTYHLSPSGNHGAFFLGEKNNPIKSLTYFASRNHPSVRKDLMNMLKDINSTKLYSGYTLLPHDGEFSMDSYLLYEKALLSGIKNGDIVVTPELLKNKASFNLNDYAVEAYWDVSPELMNELNLHSKAFNLTDNLYKLYETIGNMYSIIPSNTHNLYEVINRQTGLLVGTMRKRSFLDAVYNFAKKRHDLYRKYFPDDESFNLYHLNFKVNVTDGRIEMPVYPVMVRKHGGLIKKRNKFKCRK